jgi:hypothetical protein
MTPIERMDAVLKTMATAPELRLYSTDGEIHTVLMEQYPELRNNRYHASDVRKILDKLLIDKYVASHWKGKGPNNLAITTHHVITFAITFQGELFIQEGGYAEKFRLAKEEKQRILNLEKEQRRNNNWLIALAALTAIFTLFQGLSSAIEVYKFYNK